MEERLTFAEAVPREAPASLEAGAIHLWRIRYDRAQGRKPLVALLAAYLGVPAAAVSLDNGAHGKPRLAQGVAASGNAQALEFNWSHSGAYALVALSRKDAIGVDIERLGSRPRALEIARRFFDPAEADMLAALDEGLRERAFIGLWCAKEAVLKAAGAGLAFGLSRLAFTSPSGCDWRLARVDPELGDASDWQLAGFRAAAGYLGALAWRGEPRRIHAFDAATHPFPA